MSYKLAYSTLRWQNPDLEPALNRLAEAGWQGWESRLPPQLDGDARAAAACLRRRGNAPGRVDGQWNAG